MSSKIDYTDIRDDRIRSEICDIMSEMLDNPLECGLYRTSKFMWKMETFILAEANAQAAEIKRLQSELERYKKCFADAEVEINRINPAMPQSNNPSLTTPTLPTGMIAL